MKKKIIIKKEKKENKSNFHNNFIIYNLFNYINYNIFIVKKELDFNFNFHKESYPHFELFKII